MGMDVQFFWSKNKNNHSCDAGVDFRQWRKDFWIEALIDEYSLGHSVNCDDDSRIFRKLYKDDLIKLKNFYNGEGGDEAILKNLSCFYEDLIRYFYKRLERDKDEKEFMLKIIEEMLEFVEDPAHDHVYFRTND